MDNYNNFVAKIKKICRIDLSNYKEKQMKRRIDSLIRRNGHENYSTYIEQLEQSEQHLKEFLGYITINVSEFFRNLSQWQVLEQKIIPELLSKKRRLKVWSSACSTGEEPYSLAMLFHKMGVINSVYIIASDIDQKVIKQAQLGIYSIKGMANISNEMIK
ncbi:MAG: chemotaxis protein CheR, partial [Tepidanaerobacteraceae bacterium]|nr:chemotaxis protein CheR [Tepidanaerobacteraceae bacterium]